MSQLEQLCEETAVAIEINGISYAVMMTSPHELEDFATGFLFAEQLIDSIRDLHDLEIEQEGDFASLKITLNNRCFNRFKLTQRALKGTSGCGLCGKQSLTYAFPKQAKVTSAPMPDEHILQNLREAFATLQQHNRWSNALHAACLVKDSGELAFLRQDIGRHNALDKLVGALLNSSTQRQGASVIISSRCGTELVQKAIQAGFANLISLASPSQMAVKLAAQHRLNLIHIGRQNHINRYPWEKFYHA